MEDIAKSRAVDRVLLGNRTSCWCDIKLWLHILIGGPFADVICLSIDVHQLFVGTIIDKLQTGWAEDSKNQLQEILQEILALGVWSMSFGNSCSWLRIDVAVVSFLEGPLLGVVSKGTPQH